MSGLSAARDGTTPDVALLLGVAPGGDPPPEAPGAVRYRTPPHDSTPDDNLIVYDLRDGFLFRYADATEFHVSRDGRAIHGTWAPESTLRDTETYLLGPVLGFAQRLMGVLCLHASVVEVDGAAIALCGPAYAGKSTTAGAFGVAGHGVIADDMAALRECAGGALVMPAYDHLRVWEASEHMLLGTSGALPRLTPTWDKRALQLRGQGWTWHDAPAQLGAIALLGPRDEGPRAPRIEDVLPSDAFVALAANSYANYLLDDRMRADEFASIAQLLKTTRVFRAIPSSDPARLGALVDAIVRVARA